MLLYLSDNYSSLIIQSLQLEDIYCIGHVNHCISPAYSTILLYPHVGSHQIEDEIEYHLEVFLIIGDGKPLEEFFSSLKVGLQGRGKE